MKSLNLRSFVAVLFIAASSLVSCKKESVPPPAPPAIAGAWEGKYGTNQNQPSVYFAFIINPNGTLQVIAEYKNSTPGTGTWTLEGDTFKAIYSYPMLPNDKYNVSAKFDAANGKLTGSWGVGVDVADYGDFFMDKQ